jgi:hypothetical protein
MADTRFTWCTAFADALYTVTMTGASAAAILVAYNDPVEPDALTVNDVHPNAVGYG